VRLLRRLKRLERRVKRLKRLEEARAAWAGYYLHTYDAVIQHGLNEELQRQTDALKAVQAKAS
jgi:hypothetical protein